MAGLPDPDLMQDVDAGQRGGQGEYMHGPSPPGHLAVVTAPLPGHLNPMQALAEALVARGWRITLVHVAPARRFVTSDAVGFAALPDDADAAFTAYLAALERPSGLVRLTRMIRETAAMTDRLLAGAPAVLRKIGATAVLADAVEPAGPLIAEHLGLPAAVAVTGLPLLGEIDMPPPFVGWRYRPGAIARFRNHHGYAVADRLMRPVTRLLEERRRDWRLSAEGVPPRVQVAQCPRALDYPRSALPAGFEYGSPWRLDEQQRFDLPDDGRPLVFCSLGTLQGARPALFATMAGACAAVGARAVIGHAGGLTESDAAGLPGNPLVRAFWPQRGVLRRCAAAVVHGGFNTVLDALAAGVPIVALPMGFEQPGTAARVARIGAGLTLSPRGLRVGTLAAALREVTRRPAYRAAACSIAADIAAGGGAPGAAAAITAALRPPA